MDEQKGTRRRTARREFLTHVSAASVLAGVTFGRTAPAGAEGVSTRDAVLPTIRLRKHRVTRLVAGSNPINGYSYMGPNMDRHMKEYFTAERTVEFLLRSEQAGINTYQFSNPEDTAVVARRLRERGSRMQFISLHAAGHAKPSIQEVISETQPIAMVHHGGVTDRLFREGKSGQVHDFVKKVHDAGVLAGVSAHNPDCIRRIADEGWEVDLFMTCFYYITRDAGAAAGMPPVVTVQVGRTFYADDPLRMTEVVRQVSQPCLGFKILAAGRNSTSRKSVEDAFRFAFEHIKPTDGVIVGMYPRFHDEMRENAALTRRFAPLSGS